MRIYHSENSNQKQPEFLSKRDSGSHRSVHMTRKRILVTGGSGFLGQNIILSLITAGYSVICLDRYEAPFLKTYGVEFTACDISEEKQMEKILNGVDVVIHMACTILPQMSNSDPLFDVVTNVGGTLHLLDAAVKNHVKKVIFFSSGGTVYGVPRQVPIPETHPTNPTCSYGISKLTVEKYLRLYRELYGLNSCALRLANPYGPYQRVKSAQGAIPVFCYKALKEEPSEIWGDGSVRRDFIYVGDLVSAVLKVVETDEDIPQEINIGSGKAESIRELLSLIGDITGKKLNCQYTPARAFDVPVSMLDITLAEKHLHWKPETALADGLQKTVEYIRQNCL